MPLVLTSDFTNSSSPSIVERVHACGDSPRVAWIAPDTATAEREINGARKRFAALGLSDLEVCDIDHGRDEVQLAYLHEFDIVCLSDGDPGIFRQHLLRAGLGGRLRQALAAGRLVIADGAGAMVITPNVALFRLLTEPLDSVLAVRGGCDGPGLVSCEVLPRLNRRSQEEVALVQRYAETLGVDILGVTDGSAVVFERDGSISTAGNVTFWRRGVPAPTPVHANALEPRR